MSKTFFVWKLLQPLSVVMFKWSLFSNCCPITCFATSPARRAHHTLNQTSSASPQALFLFLSNQVFCYMIFYTDFSKYISFKPDTFLDSPYYCIVLMYANVNAYGFQRSAYQAT